MIARLQRCLTWRLAAVLLIVAYLYSPAQAALYECLDATGSVIVADSTSQLSRCTKLSDVSATHTRASIATSPPHAEPTNASPPTSALKGPASAPGATSVHLDRVGPLFVVSLTINGTRDTRLILDTGASHTILSRRIAQELGLLSDPSLQPVTMQTVGGTVRGDVVRVESIRVDGAEVRGSVAAIYDLPDAAPGIEGLLGISFLRQFEVVLDSAHNQLHLIPITP